MLTSYGSCWHGVELVRITGAVVFVLLRYSSLLAGPRNWVFWVSEVGCASVMTPKLGDRSGVQLERLVESDPLRLRWTPASPGLCASRPAQGPEVYSVGCIFGDRYPGQVVYSSTNVSA